MEHPEPLQPMQAIDSAPLPARRQASIWNPLRRNTSVVIGAIMIVAIALIGVAAPLITKDDPRAINPAGRNKAPGEDITFRNDDGERVRSARQLTRLVQETPAGRKVSVAVSREGSRMSFTVEPEAGRTPSVYSFSTPRAPISARPRRSLRRS